MSIRLLTFLVHSMRPNLRNSIKTRTDPVHIRSLTMADTLPITENPSSTIQSKHHTRYKKRFLKRQWEESDANKKENGESEEKKICDKPFERIKRKKMAMLLGYSGVNYYGMQRNPGVPTIEDELLKALLDAKYITQEDFMNQQNIQFQRSSRTDKGVSAAGQVVSLKLPLEVKLEEINSRLPPTIKIFSIKRVTNKFNSKSKCNARTYSYTLPTYVFEPSIEGEQDRKSYRMSAEKINKVNEVLGAYKKTKSYHNFTEKKHYLDPSSLRYMMSFNLERVFMESEMEFAELLVKGQSFMLHQIRKMIGLMIAVVRGLTDMAMVEKAFGKEKVIIPTAPGLGLILNKVHYERYDARYKDSHDSLTWDEQEEAINKFKQELIYPYIIKGEIEDNSMGLWLPKLHHHTYDPLDAVPEDKTDEVHYDDDDDDCDDDKKVTNSDTKKKVIDNDKGVTELDTSSIQNSGAEEEVPGNIKKTEELVGSSVTTENEVSLKNETIVNETSKDSIETADNVSRGEDLNQIR